ncbi:MAG TPA: tRNA pseudouridine(38-40) synthase TruA [Nitrospiria bacterium]|nr:tRNA pseudouridine(38-40) synthase TruA [Nitrospiria bacterium]
MTYRKGDPRVTPRRERPPRRPHAARPIRPVATQPTSTAGGSHFKLTIEYEGSRYRGWQEQSNAMTVQEVIKNALNEILGNEYQMAGAGRTDAGVHALAQVVSLHSPRAIAPAVLLDELNRRLTKDVNVLKVEPAAPDFHARHSAVARYYVYQISLRRTAFAKNYCWWVKQALDLGAIDRSLPAFLGLHDYKAFADARMGDGSTKVQVDDLRVARHGDLLLIRIGASHFLWKMVRRIVGVLVKIGVKEVPAGLSLSELGRRYAKQIPTWTAPAAGLFLERVCYPGDPPPGEPVPLIAL